MNPEVKRTFDRQHILGTIFILIAVLMVLQGLYLSHVNDQETKCQAQYNEDVTTVIAQRGQWADEDRKALNDMIFTVIKPGVSQEEATQAVQTYAETARKNDANREANPLPSSNNCG